MTVLTKRIKKDSRALIQDDETKELLSRSLQYLKAGYPVHFTGPSGAGKTSLALALAKKRKRPVMLMHGNHELNNKDLIGDFTGYTSKKVVDQYVRSVYKKDESVTETWRDGRLLEAVKNGYTLVYDEFTRSQPTTNNIFLSILEEGIIPLYGSKLTEPFIRVHPEFAIIFTSNPAEYAGVYQTQDALLDRLITINVDYKGAEQEAKIVSEKANLVMSEARAITTLISTLRDQCTNEMNGPSLRASLMIARLAIESDIPIDGKDADFQRLCIDIAAHSISRCIDEENPQEKAEQLIIDACKRMKVSEE
ncbi:gas vesicle protein GvpN [Bacillus sp. AFS015802]|uniref:Gas vesicle protein GvpN n=1 Tax=Rossellomorea vietnamensis TaxID=218284 RepID=A0A6I6UV10_9BACI|nr:MULTISPECIES: gas vesicle protein GvpN [Bacillaceae]OXS60770.1 gas vesicle protein GvpN [Bacillus sp. DSM 27956]PRX76760.1 gas vesicle protein GvpN [Bacillus sp. V-88]PFA68084.1 gas vesicle protein GvpN [Bacillus sp. AFS015802]QHE63531.1 gas vesicle protein GvpN [Rossellomorea vietnamensis]SLK21896.1 gas vesicle protein GvpN [Bacillus sp. V-88]